MRFRIPLSGFAFISTLLLTLGCDKEGGSSNDEMGNYIYPEDGRDWAVAEPEKYKFDSEKLDAVTEYVQTTDATCMMIIVGGEQIYKYGTNSEISYIASCRKSVLSMMYGKYVENGTIDLKQTIGSLIEDDGLLEDIGGLVDKSDRGGYNEKDATVLDLITCRTGIYHESSNSGDSVDDYMMTQRGMYEPGVWYCYNNWDFNFAGAVFEKKVTGMYSRDWLENQKEHEPVYRVLQQDLALPIGMCDWDIAKQYYGGEWKGSNPLSYFPAYHFRFSTRDMARLGYLMLRNGQWKDKQIISKAWVKESTAPSVRYEADPEHYYKLSGDFDYGYMWWVFSDRYYKNNPAFEGAYTAKGAYGQYIMVVPKLDMVAVWKTNDNAKCPHKAGECANAGSTRSTGWSNFWKAVTLVLEAYTEEITLTNPDMSDDTGDNLDY